MVIEITCCSCGSNNLNMIANPEIDNMPEANGWYGQVHEVSIKTKCSDCSHEFEVLLSSYKERMIIQVGREIE